MLQPKLEETLKNWDKIGKYSAWIYSQYKDFIGKNVFDIGVGIGTMTNFYIARCAFVLGADIFDSQLELVRERFRAFNFSAQKIDLGKEDITDLAKYGFDTVIMVNVLEHIEDDLATLVKLKDILADGGRIIVFAPAIPFIFNSFDSAAGHFRRYTKKRLKELSIKLDMRPVKSRYFNFFGILPYFLKGLFSKGKTFSGTLREGDSKLYNLAAALLAPIERILPPPIGLSCYIVMEKKPKNSSSLSHTFFPFDHRP
jgi:SAM-dependent methyltransferase